MKFRLKSNWLLFIVAFFLTIIPLRVSASDENIAAGSWVYSALRTFELKGLVHLSPEMPYSRNQIEFYLDRILQNLKGSDVVPSPRQAFLLKRLRNEFQGKAFRPGDREDGPVYSYQKGRRFLNFDISAGTSLRKRVEYGKGELDGLFSPGILIDSGSGFTYETVYILKLRPEWDSNITHNRVAARQKSFRGLTSEFERGYVSINRNWWGITFGRDYIHWGSSRDDGLILSLGAGPLDQVTAYLELGRFKLRVLHSILDPSAVDPRRLAGHRLSISLPGNIDIGINETVVYSGRGLDFAYLLPVGSYYANQYNERANQTNNILCGVDWKIPFGKSLLFYGEFMIDDFQYEDRETAPDKIALNLTAEKLFMIGSCDVEALLDYTYIDIYTYSHVDSFSLTRYVTGNSDPAINRIIGSSLGPDADRWRMRVSAAVDPRIVITLNGSYCRYGEGNDMRPWVREEHDPNLAFPSGIVTEEKQVSFSATFDLAGGSMLSAGMGLRQIDSVTSRSDGFAYLKFVLDL
ncbi:hypothetical protein J7M07_00365 [bacterium]|nr:hypothetical protein [bacterium]